MLTELRRRWWMLPALGVTVAAFWPLISGARTLFLRDVFNLHLPLKVAQVESWSQGRLPLIDLARAGGQPLLANPNAVALYPDNLLFAVAPLYWAFNAHFWLHVFVAPFAAYWLAREVRLEREPAWIAGLSYGLSGFFLSQLNFYNLVAGVALAPAVVALLLRSLRSESEGSRPRYGWVLLAVLTALVLLGGDPIVLVLTLSAAAFVALALSGWSRTPSARVLVPAATAMVAAALLSAAQWLPFLETLQLSFRGHQGYGEAGALAASWDPRTAVEWLVPFAFGHPNLGFWGQAFHGGDLPLFFSLYPGALTLVLVLCSGLPGRDDGLPRVRLVAWVLVATGLFFALGSANPVVRWATQLPGSGLLRFPVKAWLWVALGGSLLVGCGAQRVLIDRQVRDLARAAGVVALLFLAVAAGVLQFSAAFEGWLEAQGVAERVTEIRPRWIGLSLLGASIAGLGWCIVRWSNERVGAAGLAALHAASQLLLLQPLFESDAVSAYSPEPKALAYTEPGERLVQGGSFELFGAHSAAVSFPSRSLRWVQRRGWNELYPFAGVQYDRLYDLNVSPEGLDAFLTQMTAEAMRGWDDGHRVKLLEALGVDALIVDRELDPAGRSRVELRGTVENYGAVTYVYGLAPLPEVQLLEEIVRAPHLNASFEAMLDASFDPRLRVVVPGDGDRVVIDGVDTASASRGEVIDWRQQGDRIEAKVRAERSSVLLVQRAHLGQYRASLDGAAAPVIAGNVSRVAIAVPPGEHEVVLWVPRTTFLLGSSALLPGALLCLWLFRRSRRGDP